MSFPISASCSSCVQYRCSRHGRTPPVPHLLVQPFAGKWVKSYVYFLCRAAHPKNAPFELIIGVLLLLVFVFRKWNYILIISIFRRCFRRFWFLLSSLLRVSLLSCWEFRHKAFVRNSLVNSKVRMKIFENVHKKSILSICNFTS